VLEPAHALAQLGEPMRSSRDQEAIVRLKVHQQANFLEDASSAMSCASSTMMTVSRPSR